jgi:hypothetical protein
LAAVFEVADIAIDKLEVGPLLRGDQDLHFVHVALVASADVVQTNDALVDFEQGFEQVAADEAGYTGYKPGFGLRSEFLLERFVGSHDHNLKSDS